jgi:hypothetical protein
MQQSNETQSAVIARAISDLRLALLYQRLGRSAAGSRFGAFPIFQVT